MADRLNILALSYLFPNASQPGYGIFVLNRLRAVSRHCNVKVIAPVQWYPFIRRLRRSLWNGPVPALEQYDGMEVFHPRFAVVPRYCKWIDALSFLWSARRVARRLRAHAGFDYDLVDVHWTYPDIVAGWFLAHRRKKKYMVTVRGHEALYDTEYSIRRWLVAFFLRRADFVVALSAELQDKVLLLGVAPERTAVVLNGVDLDRFGYRERDSARAELGLDPGKRILLSVGRLTAGKGHDDLVRMMPLLTGRHDVELHIIGGINPEDNFGGTLRQLIADLELDNVHLIDGVDHEELGLWYAAADLFCLATRGEGCPNVVLEALACGVPVISTRVGAIDALVQPGVNGMLLEPGETGRFGEVIDAALSRDWPRRQIASRMAEWGWDACAKQVLSVYHKVLEATPDSAVAAPRT